MIPRPAVLPAAAVALSYLVLLAGAQDAGSGPAPKAPRVEAATPILEGAPRTNTQARALRLRLPGPRGMITDRHGTPLAQCKVVYEGAINFPFLRNASDPEILAYARRYFTLASQAAGARWDLPDEVILNHYRNRRWLPLPFTPILSDAEVDKLRALEKEKIILHASYQRFYPEGAVAAHVLGYVGKIGWFPTGPAENGDPLWEDMTGRQGLELSMEKALHGKEGWLSVIFDADGNELTREFDQRPVAGQTVISTIDLAMQKRAETILAQHCKRGAFVVIDATTGEILVLASRPDYDPNLWIPSINQKDFDRLRDDKAKPLLCRAFQSAYPPASSFKIPVALAALQSGKITADSTLPGPPSLAVGNRVFNNWNKNHEGDLDVVNAIARSCNTWFYQVALKIGGDPILDMSARLGYGQATGIPLEGESAGFIPNHAWAKKTMGTDRLIGGSLANMAIGQGAVLSTPLQVARAMAAVGNGSVLPGVSLVRQLEDEHLNVVERIRPNNMPTAIDPSAIDLVRRGMDKVVNGDNGTAKSARISAAKIAGKTGTGQWKPLREQNVAWFAGFVPAVRPRYAFAILYEGDPGEKVSGGRTAAPMAAEFFRPLMEAEAKAEKELLASARNKAIEEALTEAEKAALERAKAEEEAGLSTEDADTKAVVDEVLKGINVPVKPAAPVPPPKKRGFFDRIFGRGR